jgi:hypothetical protein
MSPVAKAPRRYFVELMSAMGLYFVTLYARNHWSANLTSPILKDALLVSPILPLILAAIAILRLFKRVDEYRRRQMLEALAIAAAVTCVLSTSWMFLVDVGAPDLPIAAAWPIFSVTWAGTAFFFKMRDKASDGTAAKAMRNGTIQVVIIAAITAAYAYGAQHAGWPASWPVLALIFVLLLTARVGYTIFTKGDQC